MTKWKISKIYGSKGNRWFILKCPCGQFLQIDDRYRSNWNFYHGCRSCRKGLTTEILDQVEVVLRTLDD